MLLLVAAAQFLGMTRNRGVRIATLGYLGHMWERKLRAFCFTLSE